MNTKWMKLARKVLLVVIVLLTVAVIFQTARQVVAMREIEQEWQAFPEAAFELGTTTSLQILPLYEKAGDTEKYTIGHGVSYLIRTDNVTLLLDVGNNPDNSAEAPFLQNMRAMGIEWGEVNTIVISHAHPDHIGGVDAWSKEQILLGSQPVNLGARLVYAPVNLKGSDLIIALDPAPVSIAPGVATMGIVAYQEGLPFSLRDPKGGEQSIVVNVAGQGLVIITGCGHPTLEQLVTRAEAVFDAPVIGVVGGLHFQNISEQAAQEHIQFLAERSPALVALSPHDSSADVISYFEEAFPESYQHIRVGETIYFP
jgi:7,8-dihydropterin-6-yl-methyl-4-(beta-D-ribofuranosyl)aminobenzene 5'-phosphate synthase